MKRKITESLFCIMVMSLLLLTGCGQEDTTTVSVNATLPIEVDSEALSNVSVDLPEEITRETISDIQHDFIKDGKQVGGIVIVDISDEMLESPRENTINLVALLGEQLMPAIAPEDIKFQYAGGNNYAFMEIATGKNGTQFIHYIFRGTDYCYDVWFDAKEVKKRTIDEILESVHSEDITRELNENIF